MASKKVVHACGRHGRTGRRHDSEASSRVSRKSITHGAAQGKRKKAGRKEDGGWLHRGGG